MTDEKTRGNFEHVGGIQKGKSGGEGVKSPKYEGLKKVNSRLGKKK